MLLIPMPMLRPAKALAINWLEIPPTDFEAKDSLVRPVFEKLEYQCTIAWYDFYQRILNWLNFSGNKIFPKSS